MIATKVDTVTHDCNAQVSERRNPLRENGRYGVVALRVNSTNPAASLVNVVVGIQVLPFLFCGQRTGLALCRCRSARGGRSKLAEMLVNVSPGPEQSLLFTASESDANGAFRLYAQSLQDANRFDCNHRTRPIVSNAGAGRPTIEMATGHHDLIFQPGSVPGISAMVLEPCS